MALDARVQPQSIFRRITHPPGAGVALATAIGSPTLQWAICLGCLSTERIKAMGARQIHEILHAHIVAQSLSTRK